MLNCGALLLLATCVLALPCSAAPRARHVILIVWDGMRPDLVSAEHTPNLWKLAGEGVTFQNHHSVFPTLTNVNGTALATGVFPGRSGLIANMEWRPEIDPLKPTDTAEAENIRKGDKDGKYLAAPTIAELVQASGKRTAIAGTKWVSRLFDRAPDRRSPCLTAGKASPEEAHRLLLDSLGEMPKRELPNLAQDQWTSAALTESFWQESVPAFSLLWLSDPDFTAHDSAPGSPAVRAAVRNSDVLLGKMIAILEAKKLRAQTDIFVVSDHGFSTVERSVDVPALLRAAGFAASTKFESEPSPGQILVLGNGGTILFHVTGRDEAITRRLVEWLQQSDFAGVIFTREKMEGTFLIRDIHLEKESGPDVIMSFRWNENPNPFGAAGMIMADWNRGAGKGTHATLSRFDIHNTLIAAGPAFRRAHTSNAPSGNIDLAPTILHILGIKPPRPLDGRVLWEAMKSGKSGVGEGRTQTIEAVREFPTGVWRQYLKVTDFAGRRYFDEGNGGLLSSGAAGSNSAQ